MVPVLESIPSWYRWIDNQSRLWQNFCTWGIYSNILKIIEKLEKRVWSGLLIAYSEPTQTRKIGLVLTKLLRIAGISQILRLSMRSRGASECCKHMFRRAKKQLFIRKILQGNWPLTFMELLIWRISESLIGLALTRYWE